MKIATFNINGIKARIQALPDWLDEAQPDVVLLQEIKSIDENFPRELFEDAATTLKLMGKKASTALPSCGNYRWKCHARPARR